MCVHRLADQYRGDERSAGWVRIALAAFYFGFCFATVTSVLFTGLIIWGGLIAMCLLTGF